jgi:hypothetical protein
MSDGHYGSSNRAIQAQIETKVTHIINGLLPSLHGIANTLTDLQDVSNIQGLEEFSSVLASIQKQIQDPTITQPQVHAFEIKPPSIERRSTKRKDRTQILPPSPERRQKRKESHAPL